MLGPGSGRIAPIALMYHLNAAYDCRSEYSHHRFPPRRGGVFSRREDDRKAEGPVFRRMVFLRRTAASWNSSASRRDRPWLRSTGQPVPLPDPEVGLDGSRRSYLLPADDHGKAVFPAEVAAHRMDCG